MCFYLYNDVKGNSEFRAQSAELCRKELAVKSFAISRGHPNMMSPSYGGGSQIEEELITSIMDGPFLI